MEAYQYQKRQPAYVDDNVSFEYEFINDQVFVHVVFLTTPTKASIEKLKTVWFNFKDYVYWQGYEDIFTYTKDPRVMNIIDPGKYLDTVNGLEVYQWVLN